MPTRTAKEGSPESFGKYMSSPAFRERRPLLGNLVAENAELYEDKECRELLYFLQSRSITAGGILAFAKQLIAANSNWQTSESLREIVISNNRYNLMRGIIDTGKMDEFGGFILVTDESDWFSSELSEFLTSICLNPETDIASGEFQGREYARNFLPVIDELHRQKSEIEAIPPLEFVKTSISSDLHDTLNYALESQSMVVIEGKSGIGKTTGTEAWMASHQGQVRRVSLSGINTKTRFFQKIAEAIGIATCQRKASELQEKIEDFFSATKLMLVIEEAQWLWPQNVRIYAAPELVDWVNTALVNERIPVALICTDQFPKLKARVEKETGWNSDQLMHRIKRYKVLPPIPTDDDLISLARHRLTFDWDVENGWQPGRDRAQSKSINLIVSYAKASRLPLVAVRDSIDESRRQARLRGAENVELRDIHQAITEYQLPSDAAMKMAFDAVPAGRKSKRTATTYVREVASKASNAVEPMEVSNGRKIAPAFVSPSRLSNPLDLVVEPETELIM